MDNKAVVPIMVQCAGLQITARPFDNGARRPFGIIGDGEVRRRRIVHIIAEVVALGKGLCGPDGA
jgi:hypothetical protein